MPCSLRTGNMEVSFIKHLGDITKINGYDIPIVDVITGGSPCQDLSVAGKRAGLDGERSGLFMEQVRIIKEMREHDKAIGRTGRLIRPRYMVWENVPGAFSSNGGKDFQAVLTEIVRIVSPNAADVPLFGDKGKRWEHAGLLYDELGEWSVAWRVHDAQYWGVPQRRKRVCVLADFGGLTAGEILFEPQLWRTTEGGEPDSPIGDIGGLGGSEVQPFSKGLPRNFEQGEQEGENITLGTRNCVEETSTDRERGRIERPFEPTPRTSKCLNSWDIQSKHIQPEDGIAEALYSGECIGGGGESYVIASGVVTKGNGDAFITPERHTSLTNGGGQAGQGYPCVLEEKVKEPIVLESNQNNATISDSGVCNTLPASMGLGGGYIPMVVSGADMYNGTLTGEVSASLTANSGQSAGHAGPTVLEATPINTMVATRTTDEKRTTFGVGEPGEPQFTLSTEHEHAVFVEKPLVEAISFQERAGKPGGGKGILIQTEKVGSLVAGNTQNVLAYPIEGNGARPSHNGPGFGEEDSPSYTLNAVEHHSVSVTAFTQNQRDEVRDLGDVSGSISAEQGSHQQTFVAAFKGGQSKDGGLGYEVEKAPTLSANPSALEPTVVINHEE